MGTRVITRLQREGGDGLVESANQEEYYIRKLGQYRLSDYMITSSYFLLC